MVYFFIIIFLIVASIAYYKIADHYNIIDKPNHRSSHTNLTIRGGGVLFYIALFLFFLFSGFSYPYLMLSATLIGGLSFIDDIKTLSPFLRLPFQFIAVALVIFQVGLGWYVLAFVPLLIVGVGFINAFNFMDGINAMTAVYTLAILGILIYINEVIISFVDRDLLIYLTISIIVFGYYNFRTKALMFAGDVGSITLAICVLFLVLSLLRVTGSPIIVLLLGVYGVDSVLTILRRIYKKEKLSDAHRHHLYQLLVDKKELSHLLVALFYGIVQLFCGFVVVYFLKASQSIQWLVSVVVLLILSFTYGIVVRKLIKA